jgi:erythrin-vacuolar iron transport family protein
MTTLGGLGHTMPYLVPDRWPNAFWIATGISGIVVFCELWAIAWVRARFKDTPFLWAAFQVIVGGVLVLIAGILIGGSYSGSFTAMLLKLLLAVLEAHPAGRRGTRPGER